LRNVDKPPTQAAGSRLLSALPRKDRDALARHLKPIRLTAGQVLFEPGDDVVRTIFPCSGAVVSLQVSTVSGREVEVATIGNEGAVGGIVSAGDKPAFGRAVVHSAGPGLVIDTARLDELKCDSRAFSDLFSRYADSLLAQIMQSVACNALHALEQRCCRWLLTTSDRTGVDVLHLTQEALAEMLGCQRTSVTAVLQSLEVAGLVRHARGRVEILNRSGLARAACECYGTVDEHFRRLLPEVVDEA